MRCASSVHSVVGCSVIGPSLRFSWRENRAETPASRPSDALVHSLAEAVIAPGPGSERRDGDEHLPDGAAFDRGMGSRSVSELEAVQGHAGFLADAECAVFDRAV